MSIASGGGSIAEDRAVKRAALAASICRAVAEELVVLAQEIQLQWEPIDSLHFRARVTVPQRLWISGTNQEISARVQKAMTKVIGNSALIFTVAASSLSNDEFAEHMRARRK